MSRLDRSTRQTRSPRPGRLRRAGTVAGLAALLCASAALALPPSAPAAVGTAADGAKVSVPDEIVLGRMIHLEGTGWKHPDGSGSAIAVKLDAPGAKVVTTSRSVADPVNGGTLADKTVHAAVVAGRDGAFSLDIPFPTPANSDASWKVGETHSVRLLTGGLKPGDTGRSVAATFTVAPASTACGAGTAGATLDTATPSMGGVVRLRGTGWCHPDGGGSRIAAKLDQGAQRRVSGILTNGSGAPDPTIWALIDADATGAFDVEVRLPDGTTDTSRTTEGQPLAEGAHWFNLLSGSLKAGDAPRSVRIDFVVGAYRPSGAPDPLGDDEFTTDTRGGVSFTRSANELRVSVPGMAEGEWAYLDTYVGGAPRAPFGGTTWFQARADGVLVVPLDGVSLPVGASKLTVQSGARGSVGRLLGWAGLSVDAPTGSGGPADGSAGRPPAKGGQASATSQGSETGGPRGGKGGSSSGTTAPGATGPGAVAVAAPAVATPPAGTPEAPVGGLDDLDSANAGEVTSVLEGTRLVVTVPGGAEGQWVHVWLYDAQGDVALGWARLDAESRVSIDVAALGESRFKLAVQDDAGRLLGWTGAGVDLPARAAAVGGGGPSAAAAPPDAARGSRNATTVLNLVLSGLGVLALVATCAALHAGRTTGKATS